MKRTRTSSEIGTSVLTEMTACFFEEQTIKIRNAGTIRKQNINTPITESVGYLSEGI